MSALKGSIVALVTPFSGDADGAVDFQKIRSLVKFQAEHGTSGIVPCGTTGESPTLSHDEHDQVISTTVEAARPLGLKVIAGTGSNSTREAVRLTARAKESGADACLIVTPYYNKPTPPGLVAHFRQLDAIGIPLVLYNIPGRSGINVRPETILEIARHCPNLCGLKASNGDLEEITETAYLMRKAGRDFAILSGDDSLTVPILSVGGVGVVSVAANIIPGLMSRLVRTYATDAAAAGIMGQVLFKFCKALLTFGSNPAPVKAVMNHEGFGVGGCRLPLASLDATQAAELAKMLATVQSEIGDR